VCSSDLKRFDEVAEMGGRLAVSGPLRHGVLGTQARRRQAFAPSAVEAALRAYVESL